MTETVEILGLKHLFARLARTPLRFPLSLACAVVWAALYIASDHELYLGTREFVERLQSLSFLGFFLMTAVNLFAEGRDWSRWRSFAASTAALALLVAYAFTALPTAIRAFNPSHQLMAFGLLGFMITAPFLARRSVDSALWEFNRAGWTSAVFGLLVAVVLGLGLNAGSRALETLFQVDLPRNFYADTWVFCMGVVWPWQALAGVPRRFDAPSDDYCPQWTRILVTYLIVPMTLAYFAILYIYLAKILVQWQMPNGEIGWLVSGYALFGVAAHLAAHPLRNTGAWLVRLFHRHFYHALFAPAALVAFAVAARVGKYGVTENRYALMLLAAWLGGIALYYSMPVQRRLIAAPLSIAVLLVAASFGPWGAAGISTLSQLGRLENALAEKSILIEDQTDSARRETTWSNEFRVSRIVKYLVDTGKSGPLSDWLSERGVEVSERADEYEIMRAMGLEYVQRWRGYPRYSFTVRARTTFDTVRFPVVRQAVLPDAGYDVVTFIVREKLYRIELHRNAATITVGLEQGEHVLFELGPLVGRLRKEFVDFSDDGSAKLMTLEGRNGNLRVRLYLTNIKGVTRQGKVTVNRVDFFALVGLDGAKKDEPSGP